MIHAPHITLTFSVKNGAPLLSSSSVNRSPEEKTSRVAGANLKKVIDGLKESLKEGSPIHVEAQMTPDKENYTTTVFTQNGAYTVLLTKKFVQFLSGAQPAPTDQLAQPWVVMNAVATAPSHGSRVCGLFNQGTDCFMNAIFQVIMHDNRLKAAVLNSYGNTQMGDLVRHAVDSYERGTTSTYTLRQLLPPMQQDGQQDAAEFFDSIMKPFDHKKDPTLLPIVTTSYHWEIKGWLGSVAESKTTSQKQPMLYIPLEIEGNSGQKMIDKYFTPQAHDGDKYKDKETGKVYSPGCVQLQIEGKPERLIFQLKRFTENYKITRPVDMPEILTVNGTLYALGKIVRHHGESQEGGHYTSVIQIEDKWMKADDRTITSVKDPKEYRQNGYLYFYELVS